MGIGALQLNGFRVTFSSPTFEARILEMPDNDQYAILRDNLDDEWFLKWQSGHVIGLPRVQKPNRSFGHPIELTCSKQLSFLASRIISVLPSALPGRTIIRKKPFTFLADDDLVDRVCKRIGVFPPIIMLFHMRPRYAFEAKIVEMRDGEAFIGVFLNVNMRWEIQAPLHELQSSGIDLKGLHAIRKVHEVGKRRLVGRISHITSSIVHLSESYDDLKSISENDVWLEGNSASFSSPYYARIE